MSQISFDPQHQFMSLTQSLFFFSLSFFLGHTIVVCFQDNLVWNQTFASLTNTAGRLDIMCCEDLWKPGTNKDSNHGHSTERMKEKELGASYKTTYPKRFLTLDPASTVAVSELYCPPNLSLYYSFIPMD